jgi:hypothetical protein
LPQPHENPALRGEKARNIMALIYSRAIPSSS